MILKVLHRTRYRYARPVLLQPHQLIVTPAESGELTTVSRSLVCDPPASLSWRSDTFGNLIAVATFAQPARADHHQRGHRGSQVRAMADL